MLLSLINTFSGLTHPMWDSQSLNTEVKQRVFLRTSHEIMNKKKNDGNFLQVVKQRAHNFFVIGLKLRWFIK